MGGEYIIYQFLVAVGHNTLFLPSVKVLWHLYFMTLECMSYYISQILLDQQFLSHVSDVTFQVAHDQASRVKHKHGTCVMSFYCHVTLASRGQLLTQPGI